MKIEIEIPDYSSKKGIQMSWEYGFTIDVRNNKNTVIIKANKAGLVSLAHQLLTLAHSGAPSGYHFHYDELNSLEDGSCEVIIEKL